MTNTQKKIQKSSKVLSIVFFVFLCSGVYQCAEQIFYLFRLLFMRSDAWAKISPTFPYADYAEVCLYYGCLILTWCCYAAAFAMLYSIFRNISREYTPFRQIHVRRMRWTALLLIGAHFLDTVLGGMVRAWVQGGQGLPFRLDPFLVPLTLMGLSFILDYACQLQAEADTTL